MTDEQKNSIINSGKEYFRTILIPNHLKNLKKLSLKDFNVNPFTINYLAAFLCGNTNPESLAKALVYPRILGTSINTSFGQNIQIFITRLAELTGSASGIDGIDIEFVDALDGRPGIYSARYAPDQKSKISKLLDEMKDVEQKNRKAHFVCTMTLVAPNGEKLFSNTGRIDGYIDTKPSGEHGFGYDPLFFIPDLNKTMAEMTLKEKNTLSHRARALRPMIEWIKSNLAD